MSETYSELFNRIYKLIQNKDIPKATALIQNLMTKNKNDINLYHLLGIAHFQDGKIGDAIKCLEKAVQLGAKDPELLNNLGNFYKFNNQLHQAERAYKQAFEVHPSYLSPKQGLLSVLVMQKKYSECKKSVEKFLLQHPTNSSFHGVSGDLYRHDSHWEKAELSYQKAIKHGVGKSLAAYLNNLGLIYLELCEFEKAKQSFSKCLEIDSSKPEPIYNLSTSLYELGDYESAQRLLEQIISSFPRYQLAHKSINEIYYQTNQLHLYGSTYQKFLYEIEFDEYFAIEYLKCLLKKNDLLEVRKSIDSFGGIQSKHLNILMAEYYEKIGNANLSKSLYQSLTLEENSPSVTLKYVEYLIRNEYLEDAEAIMRKYFDVSETDSQLALAYYSVIWKKTQAGNYNWLCDYNKFVKEFSLFDFGYSTEDLSQLKVYLLSIHPNLREPSNQSVRGGSQIPGKLLNRNSKEIKKLRQSLEEILKNYMLSLPSDSTHPFLRRNTGKCSIVGSWSIKLTPGGYHQSHIHSDGWLSSAVYIEVPEFNEFDKNGSLFLGRSPSSLIPNDNSDLDVNPTRGSVVLFPSYFWHGTDKFLGPSFRITTPFDAVPIQ
ncbi:hypothetical protein MAH1_36630 [Sessilibacter sp. MAH1]